MADITTVYGLPWKISEQVEHFGCLDDEPESPETEQHKLLYLMRHKGKINKLAVHSQECAAFVYASFMIK